jgi:hypothetical protein
MIEMTTLSWLIYRILLATLTGTINGLGGFPDHPVLFSTRRVEE